MAQHGLTAGERTCNPGKMALRARLPCHSRHALRALDNDLACDETLFRELVSDTLQFDVRIFRVHCALIVLAGEFADGHRTGRKRKQKCGHFRGRCSGACGGQTTAVGDELARDERESGLLLVRDGHRRNKRRDWFL